ncbi:hypothetical protein ACJX0J_034398, partial [Zea mays]
QEQQDAMEMPSRLSERACTNITKIPYYSILAQQTIKIHFRIHILGLLHIIRALFYDKEIKEVLAYHFLNNFWTLDHQTGGDAHVSGMYTPHTQLDEVFNTAGDYY